MNALTPFVAAGEARVLPSNVERNKNSWARCWRAQMPLR